MPQEVAIKYEAIGSSEVFMNMLEKTSKLATVDLPVVIFGERGTGKELVAERMHYLSPRWDQPFVKVNCALLSGDLLNSELFGHRSGAFTGASRSHRGKLKAADHGTIFFDEIACANLKLQEKLLRVIEYGEFEAVGADQSETVDVRIIVASNENLKSLVDQGRFRADLLDRLAFDVVVVPPLRQRQDDILSLAEHFAIRMVQKLGGHYFPGLTTKARTKLMSYTWPGNVRELRNVIERTVFHHQNDDPIDEIILDPFAQISNEPVPSETNPVASIDIKGDYHRTVKNFESQIIGKALIKNQFNQTATAKYLGLTYHQLRNLVKKLDINLNVKSKDSLEDTRIHH